MQEKEGQQNEEAFEDDVIPILPWPGNAVGDEAGKRGSCRRADQIGDEVYTEGAPALVQEENLDDGVGADWKTENIDMSALLCSRDMFLQRMFDRAFKSSQKILA